MTPVGQFVVPAAHPALPGHFPGRPVVPGVMLLDAALGLIVAARPGLRLAGLARVRFLAPVLPDDAVAVLAAAPDGRTLAFACQVGTTEVLTGALRVVPA